MRLYDDYYAARILDMLRRHCGGTVDLDSNGDPLRAELMRFCAEDEYLEITGAFGACITARITPEGLDVLEALDELPCCTPGRAEFLLRTCEVIPTLQVSRAVCGFHANDTGTLYIYDHGDPTAYFHCHGCGASGAAERMPGGSYHLTRQAA
jgi:hypothetical protein